LVLGVPIRPWTSNSTITQEHQYTRKKHQQTSNSSNYSQLTRRKKEKNQQLLTTAKHNQPQQTRGKSHHPASKKPSPSHTNSGIPYPFVKQKRALRRVIHKPLPRQPLNQIKSRRHINHYAIEHTVIPSLTHGQTYVRVCIIYIILKIDWIV
jgi:hypothetical protein